MTEQTSGQIEIFGATYNIADLDEDAITCLKAIQTNRALAKHTEINLEQINIAHEALKQALHGLVMDTEPVSLNDEATPNQVTITEEA